MAQVPSKELIEEVQRKSAEEIEQKRIDQANLGKDFSVDPDGHAAGVIPEENWVKKKEAQDGSV